MNAHQIADRIINKSGSYQEVMSYAEGMISPLVVRAADAESRAAQAEADRDEARKQLEQARDSIAAAVAEERESCAKVADEIEHNGVILEVKMKHKIAAAIRARK